jgi:hypothetical protein
MWLLLVPIAALVLAILALVAIPVIFVGLVIGLVGSLHWVAPLLLIWGFLLLVKGGPRRRREWSRWDAPERRPEAAERPSTEPVPIAARKPKGNPWSRLPIDVQVKVKQIQRKTEMLLEYADSFPPFSHDLYLVRRTASEYLPRTIETYLSLSSRTRDGGLPTAGKTPLEELKEQLQLLDSKLDEIAEDLQRKDLDRLLSNRRFLEDRFGRRPVVEPLDPDGPASAKAG